MKRSTLLHVRQKQAHYRPFKIGTCVSISFLLLGILEKWSFLSLLSLCSLIAEVGGGLCVFLVIVISPSAAYCCVYPPISTIFSLLLC